MTSFHTKTISSILDPVEQQVSRLIITFNDQNSIGQLPSLKNPVKAVLLAVEDLVKVGYETINTSNDQIFNVEMPPCLESINLASKNLERAVDILVDLPSSVEGRRLLIQSSRGILEGTFSVLITLDDSEVRRIIKTCESVLRVLAFSEKIQHMEALKDFVKELTPHMAHMIQSIVDRQKDIIIQSIVESFKRGITEVKRLIPLLISSLKLFVTSSQNGLISGDDDPVVSNRDYLIIQVSQEIQEIIRQLRLKRSEDSARYDDEMASLTSAKIVFDSKYQYARSWLLNPCSMPAIAGERNFLQALNSADLIGQLSAKQLASDPGLDAFLASKIAVSVKDLDTALGLADSHELIAKLDHLKDLVEQAVVAQTMLAERLPVGMTLQENGASAVTGVKLFSGNSNQPNRSLRSLEGKFDQAQKWLTDPTGPYRHVGYDACKCLVAEARRMIGQHGGTSNAVTRDEEDLMDACLESCEHLDRSSQKLISYSQKPQNPDVIQEQTNLSLAMERNLHSLWQFLQRDFVKQVADEFTDVKGPLKSLSEAALPQDGNLPFGEDDYEARARAFAEHCKSICATADFAASTMPDPTRAESLRILTNQLPGLSHQIQLTGRLLVQAQLRPGVCDQAKFQVAVDHFNLLKNYWFESADQMVSLVDESFEASAFVEAQESGILRDSHRTEESIRQGNTSDLVECTTSIARRANRVAQVVVKEAENSEDAVYSTRINDSVRILTQTIKPMVASAKNLVSRIHDQEMHSEWRNSNRDLILAVTHVKESVGPSKLFSNAPSGPRGVADGAAQLVPVQEMQQLMIDADHHHHHQQQQQNRFDAGQSSPENTEAEDDFHLPRPEPNQPILVAAHAIHQEAKQWSSRGNEIIAAMERIALLMHKLGQIVLGEGGNTTSLINVSHEISQAAVEFSKIAKEISKACTDKRLKNSLDGLSDRVMTLGCQLRILTTVKATMFQAQDLTEEQNNMEILVGNAQNLMLAVIDTVKTAEAASIKLRIDSGLQIRWKARSASQRARDNR